MTGREWAILILFIFIYIFSMTIWRVSRYRHVNLSNLLWYINSYGLKIITREWLYTTNHKKLGMFYIWFAGVSAIFGTTLATLVRLELSQPGMAIFANNGGAYHIVVAVHAILMVFFVVTPIVFGGFGNYFLPTQVGARDVAYPRLNNFSVWLLPAGFVGVFRALWDGMRHVVRGRVAEPQLSSRGWEPCHGRDSFFIGYEGINESYHINEYSASTGWLGSIQLAGSKDSLANVEHRLLVEAFPTIQPGRELTMTMAGWTFTTPFSHSRFSGRAVDMALAGLVFATITSIFTTINLIATWRFLRGRGARYQKELFPIFLISAFISLRLLLVVSPILTAGFVMLLADRHFVTAFFTVRAGGDILLFQHIFWFFGHPEVYILVIPGFGVASTVIPYYTRKPVSSKMHMVYAMHAIGSMSMVVWGHHMYLVGIDSKARTLFMTITIMIGLPSTIKICGWIVSAANGMTFLSLDFWLGVVFVSIFFVGGMSGLMLGGAGLDILLHDTYYVVGHFHVMLSGAMVLSVIGWLYFNFRELFGISYTWLFSGLHLFCHVIGHLLCFIPMLWLGYGGMPRRIQDYPYGYSGWHSVASFGHFFVLLGLISFSWVLFHAIFFKRPLVGRHLGMPFISSRCGFLTLDKQYAAMSMIGVQLIGVYFIRIYLYNLIS